MPARGTTPRTLRILVLVCLDKAYALREVAPEP